MNKLIPAAIVILMAFTPGWFTSCKNQEDYKYFLIRVDNIEVPEEVVANEPFELKFAGTIGYDGCASFERFITENQDSLLFIEPWGKVKLNSYACPQIKVELNREKLKYTLSEAGNYILMIKQPDGGFLEKQIKVK